MEETVQTNAALIPAQEVTAPPAMAMMYGGQTSHRKTSYFEGETVEIQNLKPKSCKDELLQMKKVQRNVSFCFSTSIAK